MKLRAPSCTLLLLALLAFGTPAWAVQVCHIPPGNPGNFHTITVSENAVQAHLGHGDYLGACFCEQNRCQNGGVCDNAAALCTCPPGFTGQFCEDDIDECQSEPCLNGGECENAINRYVCHCAPGFTGVNCEIDIDECESNPCVHGTCEDKINGYVCHCPPGFTGVNCQTPAP